MIVPFAEDVMPALAQAIADTPRRPVNMREIGGQIARAKKVRDTSIRDQCSPTVLRALLAELADGGQLVARRGAEWREAGVVFLDQRDDGWYYARPGDVERWLEEAAQRANAQRLQTARDEALTVLAERHPDEYATIVHDIHARLTAEAENRQHAQL